MLVKQNHLKINQYFIKLKFIYCEIFMLDPLNLRLMKIEWAE